MNNFFQQNKLEESRWLAVHRRCVFYAQWSQILQLWRTNGHRTLFLSFIGMHWRVKTFRNIWKEFWNM